MSHLGSPISESQSCSVMSNSLRPHGLNSPWDSPGQNTGELAFPFSKGPSHPMDWTQVSALQADSSPTEPQGKTQRSGIKSFRVQLFIFSLHILLFLRSVQLSSVTQCCRTLCEPMDYSMPHFPVHYQLWSLLKLMSTESVMPSNYLILCHSLLLPTSVFLP